MPDRDANIFQIDIEKVLTPLTSQMLNRVKLEFYRVDMECVFCGRKGVRLWRPVDQDFQRPKPLACSYCACEASGGDMRGKSLKHLKFNLLLDGRWWAAIPVNRDEYLSIKSKLNEDAYYQDFQAAIRVWKDLEC